jgi:hypothetical protein
MNAASRLLFFVLCIVFLSGCCVKFEDVAPGTSFTVGQTFYTSGTNVAVEKYQRKDGAWDDTGSAKIDNRGFSKGSGNDILVSGVNLRFKFDYPLKKITLKYYEVTGNNNVTINREMMNVNTLFALNGMTVGGVKVTVTRLPEGTYQYGGVVLEGTINEFSIGGAELWLDDICPSK